MKKLFIILLLLIVSAAAAYLYLFTLKSPGEGKVGIVEDLRNKKIVKVFYKENAFIWQGAVPLWYSIYELSLNRSAEYKISVYPPPLEELKKTSYEVSLLYNVNYRIDPEKYINYFNSGSSSNDVEKTISNFLRDISSKLIFKYFVPIYRADDLSRDKDSIADEVSGSLKSKYENLGIDMISMKLVGDIQYPDRVSYNEGRAYIAELRNIEKENDKELIKFKSRLQQVKIEDEGRYEKYREMSKIIKENPDILKFIYIDKLGANVKVIISSDSGYPLDLTKEPGKSSRSKNEEIDNLK